MSWLIPMSSDANGALPDPGWGSRNRVISLAKLIDFDQMCCRAQGLSRSTIELTTYALRKLETWLEEQGAPSPLLMI